MAAALNLRCLLFFVALFFVPISMLFGEAQNEELAIDQQFHDGGASGSNVHGIFDVSFKNDYITPRGLLVTDTGLTIQLLGILFLDVYQNADCWLNKMTIYTGVWSDLWTDQNDPYAGAWNEVDFIAGVSFIIAKDWKFAVQYYPFYSPPHNFKTEFNIEFLLAYDDSRWGYPVVINPYIKGFWTVSGDSTVVVGKRGRTYDVEFGMLPTVDLSRYFCGFPLSLSAPTWITVGPASFWNGGELGLKSVKTNFGVVSSGLRGDYHIEQFPASWGKWGAYVGFQYYYLINRNLLEAQVQTLELSSSRHAHRNVWVGYAGFGLSF